VAVGAQGCSMCIGKVDLERVKHMLDLEISIPRQSLKRLKWNRRSSAPKANHRAPSVRSSGWKRGSPLGSNSGH